MSRPLILASNDDGFDAVGLRTMVEAVGELGDVVVVAPRNNQSAKSHAFSLHVPLRFGEAAAYPGAQSVHWVDGTPADCVYVGLHLDGVLPRQPDLVVSGINHGANLAQDVHYSGTVAAAREAALRGIPAIAFSLSAGGEMSDAASVVRYVSKQVLRSARKRLLLNVNIPVGKIEGIETTMIGERLYDHRVVRRVDPRSNEYLWLGGPGLASNAREAGTDTAAVEQNMVSVTSLLLNEAAPPESISEFFSGEETL